MGQVAPVSDSVTELVNVESAMDSENNREALL
jgi:hypothetical protein